MTFFVLPNININIKPKNLRLELNELGENNKYEDHIHISKNTSKYLNQIKKEIENYGNDWNKIKKYTNPYEFIHTIIPKYKVSICKYKPISRAFFKLIEIYNTFKLLNMKHNIKTFHLAEGPGGFIEATAYQRRNKNDKYYGMTLINKDKNTPGWNKFDKFFNEYPNVAIESGVDKTGNLYSSENFKYCVKKYKNSMNIITADGGFDFSVDFEKQELLAIRLILSQVFYALGMQKFNGCFVLKVFDIFTKATLDIIYLLSCFYKQVIIVKPNTSRYANSEKYIVCKFFKYCDTGNLVEKIYGILKVLENTNYDKYYISSIINLDIQNIYKAKIEEFNTILGQQQIDVINNTIKHIILKNKNGNSNVLETIKKNHLDKCVYWCERNNMEYNYKPTTANIFSGK